MRQFDIVLAQRSWNGCSDARPWLIIDVSAESYTAFPISTKEYGGSCFPIDPLDDDFHATGLSIYSHVYDSHLIELMPEDIIKHLGYMGREMLARFCRSAGL